MAKQDVTGHNAPGLHSGRQSQGFSWKLVAAILWLLTTVALALWWLIFGLKQIDRLALIGEIAPPQLAGEIARQHRMLLSEGVTLIILLVVGGAALLYYIFTEVRRARRIQEFFAAFTHDIKTSIASLRLQAESLEEDLKDSNESKIVRRLVKDTVRLELQLENSLLLASPQDAELLLEEIRLSDVLNLLRYYWPDLKFMISGDATVKADRRALESVLKNLLQNSVTHGRATEVSASIVSQDEQVRVRLHDNGRGFQGDPSKLGKMFVRHSSTSGSGLGLYLATALAKRMKGDLWVCEAAHGFCVEITLPLVLSPQVPGAKATKEAVK